jgi:HAD superfamily hydrolase (TIGR01509 family)
VREPGDRLSAVLLDLDGTLVDSEPYWMAEEHALVAAYGGHWTDDDARAVVGNALPVSASYIAAVGGVPLQPDEIVERLLDGVVARVRERVPWRAGALDLLADLRGTGVPTAVVTMSYRRLADAVLAGAPAGSVAAVVTGDEVREGKPHPEPYLLAAARLGVDPRDCVALEDSPTGVASAEAAGCTTVVVRGVVEVPSAPGRHRVDSLTELSSAALARLVQDRRS